MADPQINFSDGITKAQREITECSVAAHVARVDEAAAKLRDDTAAAELTSAVNAPLVKIIEADPDAAKALKVDTERRKLLVKDHAAKVAARLGGPISTSAYPLDVLSPTARFGAANRIFPIPYHYEWKFHEDRAPATSVTNLGTGDVTIGVGDAEGRCSAHAGFGVSFVADRNARAMTRSLRSSTEDYLVTAGTDGSATSEGGMDMAVFEDGRLVNDIVRDRRWRKRVSSWESDSWTADGSTLGEPIEIVWPMIAGRTYNINVGAWVFCERRWGFGLGGLSWAQGGITGKVILISLFFE